LKSTSSKRIVPENELEKLAEVLNNSDHVLILAGQQHTAFGTGKCAGCPFRKTGAVVLKEHFEPEPSCIPGNRHDIL
jgi:hypothetical protein